MDKTLILNRIKKAHNLKNDAMLAKFLGIKPSTLSGWYSRNTIDFDLMFEKCKQINFDWLLTGRGEMIPNSSKNDEECRQCLAKNRKIYELQGELIDAQKKIIELQSASNEIKKYSGVPPAKTVGVVAAG